MCKVVRQHVCGHKGKEADWSGAVPDYCGSGCDQLDRFSNRDDGAVEAAASNDNWGLSFQEEGKTPVGNATPEFLKQYNAYFCGNSEDKKFI